MVHWLYFSDLWRLGDDELLKFESDNESWYCTNLKADCGLYSSAVLNSHKAVLNICQWGFDLINLHICFNERIWTQKGFEQPLEPSGSGIDLSTDLSHTLFTKKLLPQNRYSPCVRDRSVFCLLVRPPQHPQQNPLNTSVIFVLKEIIKKKGMRVGGW